MANVMDYLNWRGDLSFAVSPFNEVDNLILSQLVYVDFTGIVPGEDSEEEIGLVEASERFWERHTEEEIMEKVSMTKSAPFLMREMAKTERFRGIRLSKYVRDISPEEQSQFSVVRVALDEDSIYIAFSGTDNTIVGWRENFNMGFLAETPGQLKAVAYLNRVVPEKYKTVWVGGHSKGGNLSVYAAVKCEPQIQNRILRVYSNDGPGFDRKMVESEAYQRMLPKISTILPESSVVGMLLEHQENYEVVKSSQSFIQQHDAMSWEVLGTSFVYVDGLAVQSIQLDETLKNWLEQLTNQEREQIVTTIFELLDAADIQTVDDFYHITWKRLQELMRAKSRLPEETHKLFSRAMKLLWRSVHAMKKKNMGSNLNKTLRIS
ncbi:MAG: DUF2974 domain-containing protein [Roseburia sp.]